MTDVVHAFDNVTVKAMFDVPLVPSALLASAIDSVGDFTLVVAADTAVVAEVVAEAKSLSRFSISRRTNDNAAMPNWLGMPGTSLPNGEDGSPSSLRKPARIPVGDADAATAAAVGFNGVSTADAGAAGVMPPLELVVATMWDSPEDAAAVANSSRRSAAPLSGPSPIAVTSVAVTVREFEPPDARTRAEGRGTRTGDADLPEARAPPGGTSTPA